MSPLGSTGGIQFSSIPSVLSPNIQGYLGADGSEFVESN